VYAVESFLKIHIIDEQRYLPSQTLVDYIAESQNLFITFPVGTRQFLFAVRCSRNMIVNELL